MGMEAAAEEEPADSEEDEGSQSSLGEGHDSIGSEERAAPVYISRQDAYGERQPGAR